jgi:predicted ATPase
VTAGVAPSADRISPLVGRSEIHDALLAALAAVKQGSGGLVILLGEGGVGKSTFLRATIRDAESEGFLTLYGRALPSDLPQPFGLLQNLLRAFDEGRVGRPAATESSVLSLFLAPYEADSAGGVGGSEAGETEANRLLSYLAGPLARVEESRVGLFDRIGEYFEELSRHDPLLLVLDDIHFADELSLEFLEQFADLILHRPILVLAASLAPGEAPARVRPFLEGLLAKGTRHLTVRRMTEPEVAEYARWLLRGRDPPRESVMRWYSQTEGNPLFLESLVRGGAGFGPAAGGLESRDLEEILRGRVRALSEADRRVLVYATILGKELDFPTLAVAAGGEEEERLAESVDRLVHAGLLREKGGEVYEFVSERIRAEAYAQMTETRRRILHRKVARAIEGQGRTDASTVFELARQFYLAREDAPSLEYNRRAADLASRSYANDTAAIHLERALESSGRLPKPDPAVELRLRIELGRVLGESEELARSQVVLSDAVERARKAPGLEGDRALALLWLARTISDLGDFARARELATEAYGILEQQGNQRGLLVAHRVLGIACWRVGDVEQAEHHLRAEVALAESEGDARERGHARIDLANALLTIDQSRLPEALELYSQAEAIFGQTHEHTAQARVLMNTAILYHNAGELKRAFEKLRAGIEVAERSRSRIWIGYCRLNEAQFYVEEHNPKAARASLDLARGRLVPLGDRFAQQQFVTIEGMIREEEGDLAQAEEAFTEAYRLARELGLDPEAAEVLFRQARLSAKAGHLPEARARMQSARDAGILRFKAELSSEFEALEKTLSSAPP